MKRLCLLSTIIFSFPLIASAQMLDDFFINITDFAQFVLLPFFIGLAFLFFVIGLIRYAIFGSTNEQGREKAKALIIWSIVAFLLFSSLFAIVNVFASSVFDIYEDEPPPEPDYCEAFGGFCT